MEVNESTTTLLEADLVDENDALVSNVVISSALMTITSAETGVTINSQSAINVLSFLDTNGHLAVTLVPATTAMLDRTNVVEWRVARFTFIWSGTKGAVLSIRFGVRRVDP